MMLRVQLEKNGGQKDILDTDDVLIKSEPLTPPPSDTSSPHRSPLSSTDVSSPEMCEEELMDTFSNDSYTKIKEEPISPTVGLLDRTRLALCVFMFAVLAFNPFGILFDKGFAGMQVEDSFQSGTGTGRSLFGEAGK